MEGQLAAENPPAHRGQAPLSVLQTWRYQGQRSSFTLAIRHRANSVLYVDYTGIPKFGGYDFSLVVTCGLTRFARVFSCTKHITGEESIKILLEEWFCVYGAPKDINSDKDVRVRSDTG